MSPAPHARAAARTARTALVVHSRAGLFGADRMLLESVKGLLEADCRVVVALPRTGALVDELENSGAEVRIASMMVVSTGLLAPRGWLRILRDALRGWRAGWRLLGDVRPDVVYVSTLAIPQWPILARCRSVRSISHLHEVEESSSLWWRRLLYLPHLSSQRTLTTSNFSLETIRSSLPQLALRTEIVRNGISSPRRRTAPREPLEAPLRVLFMGQFSPRTGPDLALEAATLLHQDGRPTSLIFLGGPAPGAESFAARLHEQAADSDVAVEFAGFHRAIWPFLAWADVLLVPSRTAEPFGNEAVEAILAQRPVVASDSGGLREAAGGYTTTRLVPPGDARAMADALADLADTWPTVIEGLDESRASAQRRHSPAAYRAAIARACGARADRR